MHTESESNTQLEHPDSDLLALRLELDVLKQDRLRDKEVALETIERKTVEIGTQRIKIKQYEFALQEALLFLAKPLGKYDEWIESQSGQDLVLEFASAIPENKHYLVPPSSAKENTDSIADMRHAKSASSLPLKPPQPPVNPVIHVNIVDQKEMTDLEINCMESMRLCFNFLRNCQRLNHAIDCGIVHIPEESKNDNTNSESLALISPHSKLDAITDVEGAKLERKARDSSTPSKPLVPLRNYDNELASGDMSLEPLNDFKSPTTHIKANHCGNCHKTLLLLDTFKDKLKETEAKNLDLESRLHKEISARKTCQRAKDMIDKEIEDITAELFARANQMVVDESKRMDNLSTSNRELTKRVSDLQNRIKEKELELSKCTALLYQMQSNQVGGNNFAEDQQKGPSRTTSSLLPVSSTFNFSIVSGFDNFTANIAADGFIFQEFQDFMRILVISANMPTLQAAQAIHSSAFMRRSMIENVEPCLNYSYAPTTAFKPIGTSHTSAFKRKLLEAVIKGHVQLTLVEELKVKCLMCGIPRICEYKMVIGTDPGNSCCRCCRDRVMLCQDFFGFVTFLSIGKHTSTILATFKQIMWMRRRMGMAVVGSCSLFESETSSILGPGTGGTWETETKAMY